MTPRRRAAQRGLYETAIQRCREKIWRLLDINWPLDRPRDVLRVLTERLGLKIETHKRAVLLSELATGEVAEAKTEAHGRFKE